MDDTEEQPPLKRVATDGPLLDNDTSPSVKQNEEEVAASSSGASDLPSTSKQITVSQKVGSRNDLSKSDEQLLKLSAVLNQVWKDDLKSGQVLVSMLELFGERIFPFIPTPELSLFL